MASHAEWKESRGPGEKPTYIERNSNPRNCDTHWCTAAGIGHSATRGPLGDEAWIESQSGYDKVRFFTHEQSTIFLSEITFYIEKDFNFELKCKIGSHLILTKLFGLFAYICHRLVD